MSATEDRFPRSVYWIIAGMAVAFWIGWAAGYRIGRQEGFEPAEIKPSIHRTLYHARHLVTPSLPILKESR